MLTVLCPYHFHAHLLLVGVRSSQQPAPVRLCWQTALRLSELALPVCMESQKCLRIYVLLS